MIKAATGGILESTGIYGVDLGPLVSLVPVRTPFRNSTARTKPEQGSNLAYWRALLNVNPQQPNPAVGNDYGAASLVLFDEQDVFAPFIPLRETVRITEDAIDAADGYENAVALGIVQTINQLMIGEDKHGLMSQAYALPTISTPAVTTSTIGGSIAASTNVYVKVAARSGINYYYGGSGVASTDGTVETGSGTATNTANATVTAVKAAAAYDWYVGASSGGTYYYYTTTTTNSVVITSIPGSAQALPNLPDLWATAPTTAAASAATDTSYSVNNYNGLLASTLGDFGATSLVTPGSGTSSGAYWASLDGSSLTISGAAVAQIDAMNLAIWNSAKVSPTRYLANAIQLQEIANLILGSSAATTFLQPGDIASRQEVVAGGAVGYYLNKSVAGAAIKFEAHVSVPPGTLIAVCDKIDYPGANLDVPFRYRVQRDYSRFDYGANWVPNSLGGGPRQDIGFTVRETFENRAAATMGVLSNIA